MTTVSQLAAESRPEDRDESLGRCGWVDDVGGYGSAGVEGYVPVLNAYWCAITAWAVVGVCCNVTNSEDIFEALNGEVLVSLQGTIVLKLDGIIVLEEF